MKCWVITFGGFFFALLRRGFGEERQNQDKHLVIARSTAIGRAIFFIATIGLLLVSSIAQSCEEFQPNSSKNIKFALQKSAAQLIDSNRLSSCNCSFLVSESQYSQRHARRVCNESARVSVRRHFRENSSFYSGLRVCGSVWQCPVCSARISERRRLEVQEALMAWLGDSYGVPIFSGRNVRMITRTFPHLKGDSLSGLLERFQWANKFYQGHKRYVELPKQGVIRVLEVTHGLNGWHIHTHELLFFDEYLTNEEITGIYISDDPIPKRFAKSDGTEYSKDYGIFEIWRRACLKAGLGEPSPRAFDIRNGDYAADYFAKYGREPKESFWLASHEVTKQHTKRNTKTPRKGMTPFDLLRSYFYFGNEDHGRLFTEFAFNFKGMRQLHWSKGLKKRFGIGEKIDEELATHTDESSVKLASLSHDKWSVIKRTNLRGELLDMFDILSPQQVIEFINLLDGLSTKDIDFHTEFNEFVERMNTAIKTNTIGETYEYVKRNLLDKFNYRLEMGI